jgi:hypothetical protein
MAGVLLSATPSPAFAASGSITSPSTAAVYSDGTTSVVADATGSYNSGEHVKLATTDGPAGTDLSQNASATNCTTSLTRSCANKGWHLTYNVGVSSSRPNGKFTLTLSGSGLSSTRTFYTNFKPGDPANFAAVANGRTQVDLSWSYSGPEPDSDKAGFEVTETHNGASRIVVVPTSACSGSTCGLSLTYPEPAVATTESYSYLVTALRDSGGCGSACGGDFTRSANPKSASADLVGPPPPPSPTPTPSPGGGTTGSTTSGTTGSTGGSTGSSTGGSTGTSTGGSTGGTTGAQGGATTGSKPGSGSKGSTAKPIVVPTLPPLVASRRAFALGFNKFSPSLGIPKLPPLPATTFPVTAGENGLGDVYQPTLPYKNSEGKKTTNVLSSPIAAITSSVDTEALVRGLAGCLILLAVAAHVRFFMSQPHEE